MGTRDTRWFTGALCAVTIGAAVSLAGCSAGHSAAKGSGGPARTAPGAADGHGAGGNGATGQGNGGGPGSGSGNAPAPTGQQPGLAGPPRSDTQDSAKSSLVFPPEIVTSQDPQSTFGLDVDTASYTYARSIIDTGGRPSPTTVRPEEFINSFAQDYPAPPGDGFSVTLDGGHLPATHSTSDVVDMRLLRVGLQTRPDTTASRPDAALTFVIDVSGSMGDPGKLDLVKDALNTLVDTLRPTDSVAIVTFNTKATVVAPMTSAVYRVGLHNKIDALKAGGNTNLQAGLVTGYRVARDGFRPGITNRVIILSDGLPNTGSTSSSTIVAQVRAEADKQITLLGVGVGRDYGDTFMEQLADHADGYVVYVTDNAQARQIFVNRLPATLTLRALDAKAQVTFNPATVARYRLIGYDDRALSDSSFRNDHVDGGEVGAGHTVTALYAIRLVPGAYGQVARADVRWLDPATREPDEASRNIFTTDLDTPFAATSPRLQVCYAAGYFAEVLRGSPYGAEVRLPDLAAIASQAAEVTEDPAVTDLAATINRTGGGMEG